MLLTQGYPHTLIIYTRFCVIDFKYFLFQWKKSFPLILQAAKYLDFHIHNNIMQKYLYYISHMFCFSTTGITVHQTFTHTKIFVEFARFKILLSSFGDIAKLETTGNNPLKTM